MFEGVIIGHMQWWERVAVELVPAQLDDSMYPEPSCSLPLLIPEPTESARDRLCLPQHSCQLLLLHSTLSSSTATRNYTLFLSLPP
mmetsp:Transcript_38860/g.122476  ORF Transcript_38860/g.122476 Transcript_38860/m.122476 type:complete len:86 (+) Transcript_38860:3926-4183(+)